MKNPIPCQEGFSLPDLFGKYGTEAHCRKALFDWRRPNGFVCPECDHTYHCLLNTNQWYRCYRCHHQTSLASGTIYADTELPLTTVGKITQKAQFAWTALPWPNPPCRSAFRPT